MLDKYRIFILALSMILGFLFWELVNPKDEEEDTPSLKVETQRWDVILCRFLAFLFLHITFLDEYRQAFRIMKFTLNHVERFESFSSAFFVGFMQFVMNLAVEIYSILSLLSTTSN